MFKGSLSRKQTMKCQGISCVAGSRCDSGGGAGDRALPRREGKDGLIPRPFRCSAAAGQPIPFLIEQRGLRSWSGRGLAWGAPVREMTRPSAKSSSKQTTHSNDPGGKSGLARRSERLTFVPSFPARPGRPCSPGGPGGPGWPRSPIGPVSPVGPCGKISISHNFQGTPKGATFCSSI